MSFEREDIDSDETYCSQLSEDRIPDFENKQSAKIKFHSLKDSQELIMKKKDQQFEGSISPVISYVKSNMKHLNKCQNNVKIRIRKCKGRYVCETEKPLSRDSLKTRFLDDIMDSTKAAKIENKTCYIQSIRRRLSYINNKVAKHIFRKKEIALHVINGFLNEILKFSTVSTEDVEITQVCDKLKLQLTALCNAPIRTNILENDFSSNKRDISYANVMSDIDNKFTSKGNTFAYKSVKSSSKSKKKKRINRVTKFRAYMHTASKRNAVKQSASSLKLTTNLSNTDTNMNEYVESSYNQNDILNEISDSLGNFQITQGTTINKNVEVLRNNMIDHPLVNFRETHKSETSLLEEVSNEHANKTEAENCLQVESFAKYSTNPEISSNTQIENNAELQIVKSTSFREHISSKNDIILLSAYESDVDIFEESIGYVTEKNGTPSPKLNKEPLQNNVLNGKSSTDAECYTNISNVKHKNLDYISLSPLEDTVDVNKGISKDNYTTQKSTILNYGVSQTTPKNVPKEIHFRTSNCKTTSNISSNANNSNIVKEQDKRETELNTIQTLHVSDIAEPFEPSDCRKNLNALNSDVPIKVNIIDNNNKVIQMCHNKDDAVNKNNSQNNSPNTAAQNIDVDDTNKSDNEKLNFLNQLKFNLEDIKISSQQLQIPIKRLTLFVNKKTTKNSTNRFHSSHIRAAESIQQELGYDLHTIPTEEVMLNSRFKKYEEEVDNIRDFQPSNLCNTHSASVGAMCSSANEQELLNNYMSLTNTFLNRSLPKTNIQENYNQDQFIDYQNNKFNNKGIEEPSIHSQDLFSQESYGVENTTFITPNLSNQSDLNFPFQNSNNDINKIENSSFSPKTFFYRANQNDKEDFYRNQYLTSASDLLESNLEDIHETRFYNSIIEEHCSMPLFSTMMNYPEDEGLSSTPYDLKNDFVNSRYDSESGLSISSTFSSETNSTKLSLLFD